MEPSPPLTGAHPPLEAELPVCGARCPECGKPCLQAQQHSVGEAHSCERNHRWGAAAEVETEIKAR